MSSLSTAAFELSGFQISPLSTTTVVKYGFTYCDMFIGICKKCSNFIYGEIPETISTFTNLTSFILDDNLFNGSVPDLRSLLHLEELNLGDNRFEPEFPYLGTSLIRLVLKNNSLRSVIPPGVGNGLEEL